MTETTLNIGTVGIIGGTGTLGSAIVRALLARKVVSPDRLWLANRSGEAGPFSDIPGINVTRRAQDLAETCDVIVLSVPPASIPELDLTAPDALILSVMAGVSLKTLTGCTGAPRAVRAMSSPAAARHLAYSPWIASATVTEKDRARVTAIFGACGTTDEIADESQIDIFTAMTGPVPGFVALYAQAMTDYAANRGVSPDIADRAVRQLFLGAGLMMSDGPMTPADHVAEMIDYAGTTAAGLEAMLATDLFDSIAEGLDAAVARTLSIAPET
ncbi:pyrroline-5-carboxylate reductase family protein [Chachezhania antarctica]|uniref:pyrroline-5-carboxylate reductase family protein n=1 Tax=Chachezhania antarctica TaxID=2340860 RepID=UPI000EAB4FB0|nr:pyrroline-5-carboxylate reductase dimerization domain-containing protein [Chachezhania antarctica]|tara:strand:+ start:10514 stop:11329 length:816 start_codon:yes stop_codon:yes gene_type:complete